MLCTMSYLYPSFKGLWTSSASKVPTHHTFLSSSLPRPFRLSVRFILANYVPFSSLFTPVCSNLTSGTSLIFVASSSFTTGDYPFVRYFSYQSYDPKSLDPVASVRDYEVQK